MPIRAARIGCGKYECREFRDCAAYPPYFLGMLVLTPEAVGAVVEFVVGQDAGATAGLRISPGPHSAVDRTWDYSVVHEPFEGDVVIEDGRARVFVDSDAAKELEHAVLDANVDEHTLEPRFIVRTRNAS